MDEDKVKNEESVTVVKPLSFYFKNREKIWAGIFIVVGLVGGNVDRVREFVPDISLNNNSEIELLDKKVDDLITKINELDGRNLDFQDKLNKTVETVEIAVQLIQEIKENDK